MKNQILRFAAAMLCSGFFSLPVTAAPSDPLDELIQTAITETEPTANSGLAVAVVKDGSVIFQKGYGYRDRELKLPVTTKTHFLIGSTTKAFTAAALKIAEARGLIDLEMPVTKYVPEFSFSDPEITRQATLIDLLSHRTGLPRHDALWYLSGWDRNELVKHIGCLSFSKNKADRFRGSFVYNNLLYMTAGIALERVSGETWERFLSENIFDVLGMKQTGFFAPDFSTDFAQPYSKDARIPYKDYSNIAPAASIVTNVEDLSLWVLTHLAHGRAPNGAQLLTESQMASMYQPFNKVNDVTDYGLGWMIEKSNGTVLVSHDGDADGYHAYVSFMPSMGIGVIAISNQHISNFPDLVAHRIYDRLLGNSTPPLGATPFVNPLDTFESPLVNRAAPAKVPFSSAFLAGDSQVSFNHCGYGKMTVSSENGADFLIYGQNKWVLNQIPAYGYYFDIDAYAKRIRVPFRYTPESDAIELPLEPTADSIRFVKE